MELVKYAGKDCVGSTELMDEGFHLPGLRGHDSETLCGACLSGAPKEAEYDDKPTCRNCIAIAKEIFKRYTKKQVASW